MTATEGFREVDDMANEAVEWVSTQFPVSVTAEMHLWLKLVAVQAIRFATADFTAMLAARSLPKP